MAAPKPKDVDDYISRFPEDTRKIFTDIRTTIRKNIPGAEETISYGIPTFKLNGRYVIYFAGYKKHIGLYPVPSGDTALDKAFSPYKTSGKGTIQFALDEPIPHALIAKIVKYRLHCSSSNKIPKYCVEAGASATGSEMTKS